MTTPLWKRLGLPKPRPLATLKPESKKPRKAPTQWEEQYQITVAEFFSWALPRNCVWYAVPNGKKRSKKVAGILKAMGAKAGVHDFVLLFAGVHHELELKWGKGSMSPDQKAHAAAVVAAGGKVGVAADTLDDVCRQLDEWGIPHQKLTGGPTPKLKRGPDRNPDPVGENSWRNHSHRNARGGIAT